LRKILTSLIIIAVVAVSITAGALAVFTDRETVPDNAFTTGTLILDIDPTTAMFDVSNMAPGDVVFRGLQVTNDGSLALRYAMTTTADAASALDEQLDLTIDVVTGAGGDGIWYTADDVVGAANIYGPDGALSSAFFGNPAQGGQTGDRTLASGTSERLRFKATLPLDTGNAFQGASCSVAFVFDAQQTVNNP